MVRNREHKNKVKSIKSEKKMVKLS
uniref:Lec-7 protein n=1 Tax=Caenorhabditis elegans TaxID=6239 RepID=G5EDA2_CAEEL|nr:lec-7 [Caenorhabditis elegans]BAB11974.1 lec-7 [Caenorhabditis elegans]